MAVTQHTTKRRILRTRRHRRVRANIQGTTFTPRLCVFRSHTATYAQIIDDSKGKTVLSAHDSMLSASQKKANKSERAELVGKLIADRAQKAGIRKVLFDRGGYRYNGRVKAFAEGARKGGLIF